MPYQPRVYFKAKLEPKATVLHGAGQDIAGFNDYSIALGPATLPVIYMTYVGVAGNLSEVLSWSKNLQKDLKSLRGDVIPQIGVAMVGGFDTGAGLDAEVAAGRKDANIEAFCLAVKALNRPVFVRIGYEFEGSWNGYRPETYKQAFIRITQIMRKHNLNFATVWCSGGGSAGNIPLDAVMQYYPGDQWVDWWSLDIFSPEEINSNKTHEFCDASARHRKPMMIGESTPRYVGVLDGRVSWDRWFAPYFQLIESRPEIKAFCYINWNWVDWAQEWGDWGDCRIERNAYVTAQYRNEMTLPLYEHRKTK